MKYIYIIMFQSEIAESSYFTNETKASQRVEYLNNSTKRKGYWYKTLSEY